MVKFWPIVVCSIIMVIVGLQSAAHGQQITGHCEDERIMATSLAIRGLKPSITLTGQYGERYVIFTNNETGEWYATRTLFRETNACLMAAGEYFKLMFGKPV